MSEVPEAAASRPDVAGAPGVTGRARPAATGVASIDTVLDLVAGLDGRPVAEHAAVFEAAHAELRRALDDAPAGAEHSSPA